MDTMGCGLKMIPSTRSHIELTDDIFLYTSTTSEPLTCRYEIESAKPGTLKFTMSFDGSENIFALRNGEVLLTSNFGTVGQPFQRSVVGILQQIEVSVGSRLKLGYEWEIIPLNAVDIARNAEICVRENDKIKVLLDLKKAAEKMYELDSSDFIDIVFPPITDSSCTSNNLACVDNVWRSQTLPKVFRRLDDFMNQSYKIFEGKISPLDIRKGCLGDDGFLCALACLAEHPDLIKRIFVSNHSARTRGQYGVYLHTSGLREMIIIDDYIPCYPNGGPIFARGHGNDVWVMLLQKAYAKAVGGYEYLKNIPFLAAVKDLTGVPCLSIVMQDLNTKNMIKNDTLWLRMKSDYRSGFLMSLSTATNNNNYDNDIHNDTRHRRNIDLRVRKMSHSSHQEHFQAPCSSLRHGYTYVILKIKESKMGDRLVQLRNPWGDWNCSNGMEWIGKWSDDSPFWTEDVMVMLVRIFGIKCSH